MFTEHILCAWHGILSTSHRYTHWNLHSSPVRAVLSYFHFIGETVETKRHAQSSILVSGSGDSALGHTLDDFTLVSPLCRTTRVRSDVLNCCSLWLFPPFCPRALICSDGSVQPPVEANQSNPISFCQTSYFPGSLVARGSNETWFESTRYKGKYWGTPRRDNESLGCGPHSPNPGGTMMAGKR